MNSGRMNRIENINSIYFKESQLEEKNQTFKIILSRYLVVFTNFNSPINPIRDGGGGV